MVKKQYKGKGYKIISISSSSSISISLHSDYFVNTFVAGKRKHKDGFVNSVQFTVHTKDEKTAIVLSRIDRKEGTF